MVIETMASPSCISSIRSTLGDDFAEYGVPAVKVLRYSGGCGIRKNWDPPVVTTGMGHGREHPGPVVLFLTVEFTFDGPSRVRPCRFLSDSRPG